MYTIDVMLKYSPAPISVQRKEENEANELYQKLTAAMTNGDPKVMELTCDRDVGKKVTVLCSEISVVQMSQKSGASADRVAGFAAIDR
jgi:hypothetical protein